MVFLFICIPILIENYVTNSGDPDQMPHHTVSNLCLHYLSMSHKHDDRLIRVKMHTWKNPYGRGTECILLTPQINVERSPKNSQLRENSKRHIGEKFYDHYTLVNIF